MAQTPAETPAAFRKLNSSVALSLTRLRFRSDGDGLDDATGGDARCSTVTNLECVYAMRNFTLNGTDCAEGLLDVGGVVRIQKTPFLMSSLFTFIRWSVYQDRLGTNTLGNDV